MERGRYYPVASRLSPSLRIPKGSHSQTWGLKVETSAERHSETRRGGRIAPPATPVRHLSASAPRSRVAWRCDCICPSAFGVFYNRYGKRCMRPCRTCAVPVRLTENCQPFTGSIGYGRSSSLQSFQMSHAEGNDGPMRQAVLHHGRLPAQTVRAATHSSVEDSGQATFISRLRANERDAMRLSAPGSSAAPDTKPAGVRGHQLQGTDRTTTRWPRVSARTALRTPARPAVSRR